MSEPPLKPSETDCCHSGCNPCVLDVYEDQLRKFQERSFRRCLRNCVNPTQLSEFKLIEKRTGLWEPDVVLMKFTYSGAISDEVTLSYNPGQYFMLRSPGVEQFSRAYTAFDLSHFEDSQKRNSATFWVLIKLLECGKMSQCLRNLQLGAATLWRGPYGDFEVNYRQYKHILFVAQGTGIAPIFAIIQSLLQDDTCETFLKLFFCCRSHILLHEQLYDLSRHWNFTYKAFISAPSPNFVAKYNEPISLTKLSFQDIKEFFVKVGQGDALKVVVCGSKAFGEVILDLVQDCGINCSQIYIFR